MTNAGEDDIIKGRKIALCPTLANLPVPRLVLECTFCDKFLLYCCSCFNNPKPVIRGQQPRLPCHHYRVVFTDGACTNNGSPEAKAGIGIAYGASGSSQLSLPITDSLDSFSTRSNQRAEFLAARLSLKVMAAASGFNVKDADETLQNAPQSWIIATDSEYVVKGMTEWLPRLKKNNWRTAKGTIPVNLDQFLDLDRAMAKYEAKNVKIGFWRIPREHDGLADSLAKAAAVSGHVASM